MTEVVDKMPPPITRPAEQPPPVILTRPRSPDRNLTDAVCWVLQASSEPLTPSKVRAQLSGPLRRLDPQVVGEALRRQVEAGVLYCYCPYRSQQPRYWDRPMPDHVAALLVQVLAAGPLTCSQIFRKLPEYAHGRVEEGLRRLLAEGRVHRHPGGGPRGGDRFGLDPPDPRGPMRLELERVFARLSERLGFTEAQLRAAALDVLRDNEWGPTNEPPSDVPSYQE
jgi:hypothetical protein